MTIKILSEETINKIAAGEVVERPANAVKELIENSLDAKSTNIEVEIKSAGRQLIRVRDNGSGMTKENLKLALTRHATSKITSFSDLETLSSMGFRGEALPSIAAVSHLLIQSKQKKKDSGWEESYSGGKLKSSRAWAGADGTAIEVKNLFFNTPARAKFLKSELTERHHIIRTIEETALTRPQTSFKVISEGKLTLNAPCAKTRIERITDVLGNEFASKLIHINVNHPNLKIEAYITKTENSMPSRKHQFLFINNRPVNFGRVIMHSLYEAYREHLASGRHPGVLIYLETNPAEIDVNIHPTKREVRFSKEQEMHNLIYRSLKDALIRPINISLNVDQAPQTQKQPQQHDFRRNYEVSESARGYISRISANQPQLDVEETSTVRPLGQAFNLYAVAQDKNELLIIDQHAAAERIRYEKYLAEWEKKQVQVQPLLIPLTLEVSASQSGLIRDNTEIFKELGWEISEFGTNTIRINTQPNVLGTDSNVKDIIESITDAIAENKKLPLQEKLEKIIRTACRKSIKANEAISHIEISRMVKELLCCKSPYTCPHGRPTMIKLSKTELSKKFGR